MSTKVSKTRSSSKLRQFCSNPPQGMISFLWFNGLVSAYHLQFLLYSQFSTYFVGTKKTAKDKIFFGLNKK
ncbi:MAG: hypothetical protein FJX80_07905 [Bacteroidetes bacterium]|nr:hypothetical protein [Bacteroidota bacterium]